MSESNATNPQSRIDWRSRIAVAGFSFFLVKGLAWLSLPLIAQWFLAGG